MKLGGSLESAPVSSGENGKGKKSIFETMRDLKKAVVFTALLAFAAPAASSAAEKFTSPDSTKISDVEKSKETTKQNILKIAENLKSKGIEGKMGQTPVRKWKSADNDTVTVGYDKNGKEAWISEEKEGAAMKLLAKPDGTISRVIINGDDGPANKKSTFNDLKTFSPMENLAQEAEVGASMLPEKVKVYSFSNGSEGPESLGIDFQTGESARLVGEEATKLTAKIQNMFNEKVAQHSAEISK